MRSCLLLTLGVVSLLGSAATASSGKYLGVYATGRGGLTYRLVIGRCTADRCVIEVQLVKAERVVSRKSLGWKAIPPIAIVRQRDRARWGVGDPLSPARVDWLRTSKVSDSGSPMVYARPLRIGKSSGVGLLVTLVAGFEHVHRRHELFAVTRGSQLARVWQADEGAGGPRWSSTTIVRDRADGFDRLLHFDLFDLGGVDDDQPDTWTLAAYRWHPKARQLKPTKTTPPVYLAIVGTYRSTADARKAKGALQASKGCLALFSVVRSEEFPRLKRGLFVIAALSSQEALSRAALATAKQCNPALEGYVKRGR